MPYIKHMKSSQQFSKDGVTIYDSEFDLEPINPNQISIKIEKGKLMVIAEEISFQMNSSIKIHKIIKTSGDIKIRGELRKIELDLKFLDFIKNDPKPYVRLDIQNIEYSSHDWHFRIDVEWIPEWLIDSIVHFLKRKILKKEIPSLIHNVVKIINKVAMTGIKKYYPDYLEIKEKNLGLATKITGKPILKNSKLLIHIDGTFYRIDTGYRRIGEPGETEMHQDPLLLNVFLTDYSINTFFDAIYNQEFSFKKDSLILKVKVKENQKSISLLKDFIFVNNLYTEFGVIWMGYQFLVLTRVNFKLSIQGISKDNSDIKLKIENFEFSYYKPETDSKIVIWIANLLKQSIITFFQNNPIVDVNIPKFKLPLDIEIKKIDFKVFSRNIRGAVDLQYV